MATEKIYELQGDLYSTDACVTACRPAEGGYEVTLDRTVFFPGGGGQEADSGTVGGLRVLSMSEQGEEVVHLLPEALEVGQAVECRLDVEPRLRRMQNHGGEHIISGIVNRQYGFNNVGFHMGSDDITIDFDGVLTREQLCRVEMLANRAVTEDRPISVSFPSPDQLAELDYRSKKALSGRVRIVEIENFEMNINAGNIKLNGITVDYIYGDIDAGNIEIYDCTLRKVEFEINAGNYIIKNSEIENLNIDTNAGNIEISDTKLTDVKIEANFGSVDIDGLENIDEYEIECEVDAGVISVGDTESIGHYKSNGSGAGSIKINVDAGNIEIDD